MQIAVIGGGNGSFAAAADLTLRGHSVRFFRRDEAALAPTRAAGGIELEDFSGIRLVPIDTITSDLAEAVSGAELIVAPIPAFGQDELARALAPLLSQNQILFLPPGTFGTYAVMARMRAEGMTADVAIAEAGTLPWLCRKRGDNRIAITTRATRLPTGIFPARHSECVARAIAAAFPAAIEPVEDALSGALMNAGPIIHPPLVIMNTGPIEHFADWDIHNEGTQPAVRRVITALDGERIAIREALGYAPPHFPLDDHYSHTGDEWMYGTLAHDKLTDSGDWREHLDLHTHRYMREDVVYGLPFLVSVGRWCATPTPVAAGLLAIGAAMLGEPDLATHGRSLEALGLANLTRREMDEILQQGI